MSNFYFTIFIFVYIQMEETNGMLNIQQYIGQTPGDSVFTLPNGQTITAHYPHPFQTQPGTTITVHHAPPPAPPPICAPVQFISQLPAAPPAQMQVCLQAAPAPPALACYHGIHPVINRNGAMGTIEEQWLDSMEDAMDNNMYQTNFLHPVCPDHVPANYHIPPPPPAPVGPTFILQPPPPAPVGPTFFPLRRF